MNKIYILIILYIIALLKLYLNTIICPCDNNINKGYCYRYEFYGILPTKFITRFILGYFFYEYYLFIIPTIILFEIFEMYLDKNDELVLKYGGCLDKDIYNKDYIVGYGENKYLNPIDRYFNINNSKKHIWHGSVAEIFASLLFFVIGYLTHLYIN
jgi:hypothetical protein